MKYLRIVLLLLGAMLCSAAHADLSTAPQNPVNQVDNNSSNTVDLSTAAIAPTTIEPATAIPNTSAFPTRINTKNLRSDGSFFQSLVSLFKPAKADDDASVNISLHKRMVTFSFAF